MKKPSKLVQPGYTIEVDYNKDATSRKLMKFIPKSKKPFVISAEEMMSILVSQVNSETLEAAFVESDRVHVVEVSRQLKCRADKDIKMGDEIRITYNHPLPIEFALIEEAWKIAQINQDVPVATLTKDYIDAARKKMKPVQKQNEGFLKSFYAFFTGLKIQ
jgi:ribosomal 50S subunit-recycling heat shock protein